MEGRSLVARFSGPFLILAIAAAVPIHRVLLEQHEDMGPWNLDLLTYFHPLVTFVHHELQQGRLPLWNPYQYAGQPLLAFHTTAILYPPNLLLFALLGPGPALVAHFAFHLLVAGAFTWLYAGRLGLSRSACAAAAVAFMLSGPLMKGLANISFIATEAWLPAVLWALHGLCFRAQARWAVLLAVFLSMAFLGGQAQQSLYILQFALVYGLFCLFTVTPRAGRGRVVGLAIASGVLAFGLVAPQLFPTLELAAQSIRGLGGIPFDQATVGSLKLAGLFVGLVGGVAVEEGWAGPLWSQTVRLPFLALPLALCALLLHRERLQLAFLSLWLIACALFMLGSNGPVFELYFALPLGDLFRIPTRLAFIYQLLFAVLIAFGIDALRSRLGAAPAWRRMAEPVALALVLLLAVDQYTRVRFPGQHPVRSAVADRAPPELVRFAHALPGRERLFLNYPGPLPYRTLPLKSGMMDGFFALSDYEPNMPLDYARYFDREFPWPGLLSIGSKRADMPPITPGLLDLMSVRYYVTPGKPRASPLEDFAGGQRLEVGDFFVFEREEALPRTYAVRRVSRAVDLDEALARVLEEDFRPREEAIVVGPEAAARVADPACAAAPDTAELESHVAHEVRIRASCECECLLVLTDLHYPGWRVRVDGEERPIQRVNAIYRGVELRPGQHSVVYSFEPDSFRAGLLVLVVAAAIGVAGIVFLARRPLALQQTRRAD